MTADLDLTAFAALGFDCYGMEAHSMGDLADAVDEAFHAPD
jgi:hypothetical protein